MNTQFWVIQAFNGISYGALLFLVGSGLSLIFGVMRIVNLSHGAYFLWGGYIALSVIWATGSWALSLPAAALAVAVIGLLMERLFLRSEGFAAVRSAIIALGVGVLVSLAVGRWGHFFGTPRVQFVVVAAIATVALYFLLSRVSILPIEADPLRQVLLTVGFAYLFQQAALDIWGGDNMDITPGGGTGQKRRARRHLFSALPRVHDRHGAGDRRCTLADDGEDAHGRGRARDRRRRANGARRRHRHQPHLHVHLRARRFPCRARRCDRRRLSRRLSRPRFRDAAAGLCRRHHRRHGQPWRRGHWRAGGRPCRQFRQGAVPGSLLFHALRADGFDPGGKARLACSGGSKA